MKNATNSCPCVLPHFHLGARVLSEWGWGVSRWKGLWRRGMHVALHSSTRGRDRREQTRDQGYPENSQWLPISCSKGMAGEPPHCMHSLQETQTLHEIKI
ncbi:unnamed protein product [Gulo gulo]|uniref:Uncharacterized protein n=1 Tax=Gulo gulo TaxID=48420 RepID=A0A9X9MC98_GULGU|nr:unnamed protein product [Gulo gulo]